MSFALCRIAFGVSCSYNMTHVMASPSREETQVRFGHIMKSRRVYIWKIMEKLIGVAKMNRNKKYDGL